MGEIGMHEDQGPSEFRLVHFPAPNVGEPEDPEREAAALRLAIERLERGESVSMLQEIEPMTPRVAGGLLDRAQRYLCGEDQDLPRAEHLAFASAFAGALSSAPSVTAAGWVCLGNVYLQCDRLDDAEQALREATRMPDLDVLDQEPQIRLGLAAVARARGRPASALRHAELALRWFRARGRWADYDLILESFLPLYRQVQDLAGLVHVYRRLDGRDPRDVLRSYLDEKPTADHVIGLTSRLHALGEHELANETQREWINGRNGDKEIDA